MKSFARFQASPLFAVIALFSTSLALSSTVRADFAPQQQTTLQPSLGVNFFMENSGFVEMFAGNFSPFGAPALNGQLLPIASNPDLFQRLGTTYGGDGTTTFAMPDLNGRAATGVRDVNDLGQALGQDTVSLSTPQYPAGMGGLAQPFTNLQPSLKLNYVVALKGIFPSPDGSAGNVFLGEVKLFAGDVAPNGWAFANGNLLPINQNQALFSILGTTYGGNGQTTFALPDLRDRVAIGTGAGAGLTPRILGETTGSASTVLNDGNLPTSIGGLGLSYNNMQPSLSLNYLLSTQGIFPARDGGGYVLDPDVPILGQLTMFAGNFTPHGWLKADGTVLSIAQNTALFSLLGTQYGGNGTSLFDLPDLKGRAPVGADITGILNGLTQFDVGEKAGVESLTLTATDLGGTGPEPTPVPEPATFAFIAGATVLLVLGRRLRRRG